jgi:hypothetical protein
MLRFAAVFAVLFAPVVAYAATGGEQTTASLFLQTVNLAVNAFIASRIKPLEKRVKVLEDARGGITR